MAKCSEEVIYEGWLTKSPPTKRIWRARWRKRWFLLTHSGDIPGQYVLTYYTNRTCSKLKGVIDLDHCEQVDLGLKLEERNLKFDHIFGIKTPSRTYYLAADTEEEMKSWVTYICRVCGLKSTNEEEELGMPMNGPDIEITEESNHRARNANQSPPISPVSTSPYIPISECITGKSPVFDPKDFNSLLEYNQRQSNRLAAHSNDLYDHHSSNSYVNLGKDPDRNYVNDVQDPRFYDSPRQLLPVPHKNAKESLGHSPLRSPIDSDNVFHEDVASPEPELGSLKNLRPSDGSIDFEQKYGNIVDGSATLPPPRPPKPSHIQVPVSPPQYFNLAPAPLQKSRKGGEETVTLAGQKVISDDMYDFPRSHNVESEQIKNTLQRRHCYNNAAPAQGPEGTFFRYDISPKPATSSVTSFSYDVEATQELEPSSPAHSHSSSTPAYSNLPSPLLTDSQVMPPPTVNRYLKPKRKKSETLSTSSTNEPPSPRSVAPSVDRKLKPPAPSQEAHTKKTLYSPEEDVVKRRAAPSPTPPGMLENTCQNQEETYHYVTNHLQYLDLVLEPSSPSSTTTKAPANQSTTVYKHVDFMKTQAFNITRNNLVKERQEPVTTFVKK